MTTLIEEAKQFGIELNENDALDWISTINSEFPSIKTSILHMDHTSQREKLNFTIAGTPLPLSEEMKQNTSIWNTTIRTSSNELVI